MADHHALGQKGEKMAARYLVKNGYEILDTNWRWQKAELDIIARNEDWLVFVEVKTRKKGALEDLETSMGPKKQKQLIMGANAYVDQSGIELECRFDVISIAWSTDKSTITHYCDAFYPRP